MADLLFSVKRLEQAARANGIAVAGVIMNEVDLGRVEVNLFEMAGSEGQQAAVLGGGRITISGYPVLGSPDVPEGEVYLADAACYAHFEGRENG